MVDKVAMKATLSRIGLVCAVAAGVVVALTALGAGSGVAALQPVGPLAIEITPTLSAQKSGGNDFEQETF